MHDIDSHLSPPHFNFLTIMTMKMTRLLVLVLLWFVAPCVAVADYETTSVVNEYWFSMYDYTHYSSMDDALSSEASTLCSLPGSSDYTACKWNGTYEYPLASDPCVGTDHGYACYAGGDIEVSDTSGTRTYTNNIKVGHAFICPDDLVWIYTSSGAKRVGWLYDPTNKVCIRQLSDSVKQLELRAGFGVDPNSAGTEAKNVGSGVISVYVPLGAQFFIQTVRNNLPVSSLYTLSESKISPSLPELSLFTDTNLVEFNSGVTSSVKYFRAVHLGTQTLTITPSDTSLSPISVKATVTWPLGLGNTHNQYDAYIINNAHQRGIPPQYVKGQIEQESRFDQAAYRYEPVAWDMVLISNHDGVRTVTPYSSYRLETDDGLSQGADLVQEDISPRNKYLIYDKSTRQVRHINDSDTLITAENIYTHNPTQGWSMVNPSDLDFTAQTAISSSYGLFQMSYLTAIIPLDWDGTAGHRNPSYLFDSEQNLINGNGSMPLAAKYFAMKYARANRNRSITFVNLVDFSTNYMRAYNWYNHNSVTGSYGSSVMTKSDSYKPTTSFKIFQ